MALTGCPDAESNELDGKRTSVLCVSATLPFSCLFLRLLIIQIYLSAHWHIKPSVYCVCVRVCNVCACVCVALPAHSCCGCRCQLMPFNETTAKLFNEFRFIAHTHAYVHTHTHTGNTLAACRPQLAIRRAQQLPSVCRLLIKFA